MESVGQEYLEPEIQAFILEFIPSIGHLEALILLKKNYQLEWSAQSISKELRTNKRWATQQLDWLNAKGLIRKIRPNTYKYVTTSRELDEKVLELANVYSKKRMTVINFVSARSSLKIREFANAFKL